MTTLLRQLGRPTALTFALILGLALFPHFLRLIRRIWHRPALAVAATVVALGVPWRSGEEATGLVHVTLADIFSAVLVAMVAVRVITDGGIRRLPGWIAAYLSVLTLTMGVSTMLAPNVEASLSGLIRYLQIFVLVPIAVFYAIRRSEDRKLLLGTVIGLGLFESVVGISQFLGASGAGFGSQSIRATGTFGAFNLMAYPATVTLAMIGCVAIWVTRPRLRLLMLPPILLLGTGLAVSLSRGAWLATATAILTVLVVTNLRRALAVFAVLAIMLGSAAVVTDGPITDRLLGFPRSLSGADQSVVDRYALWEAGTEMFLERPVFGFGPKSYSSLRDSYAPLNFSGGSDISDPAGGARRVGLTTPHNRYVLILVEFGIAGGLAVSALLASLFLRTLARVRGRADGLATSILGLTTLGWLVAYLTTGIYEDVGGPTMALQAVMLGATLWYAGGSRSTESKELPVSIPSSRLPRDRGKGRLKSDSSPRARPHPGYGPKLNPTSSRRSTPHNGPAAQR